MATKKGASSAPSKKSHPVNKPPHISVKIDRMVDYEGTNVKAIASANIANAFAIHGLKVCDSQKGLFVSMPNTKYEKNGKAQYSDVFHAITKEARDSLNNAVLSAYEQRVHMAEDQAQDPQLDDSPGFGQSM